MKSGFEIISGIIRILIVITVAGVLLFPISDNPNYKRILIVYPMLFSLWVIIEKYFETNKFIQEYSFVIFQLITGLSVVQGTILKIIIKCNFNISTGSIKIWAFLKYSLIQLNQSMDVENKVIKNLVY